MLEFYDYHPGKARTELFIKMYECDGMTLAEIGENFDISRNAVHLVLKKHPRWKKIKLREPYYNSVNAKWVAGELYEEIAICFGTRSARTYQVLKGLEPIKPSLGRQPLTQHQRFNNMIKSIWQTYERVQFLQAGVNFQAFIMEQIPRLNNPNQILNMNDYYLNQIQTNRFRRGTALRKLGDIIRNDETILIKQLIEKDVLVEA